MNLRVDLHIHTVYSDGRGTIDAILARAEQRGLDGIAVTDHGTIAGALEAKAVSRKLLVIPGCEVTTDFGHLLALGVESPLPSKLEYMEALERIRSLNGVAVLAHPYAGRPKRSTWEQRKPDAIETVNALYPLFKYLSHRSQKLAEGLGLAQVGGSDAHYAANVGDAYTVVEVNALEVECVLEAIRKGLASPEGNPSPTLTRLRVGLSFTFYSIRGF